VIFELAGGLPIAPQVTAALPASPAIDWSHEPTVFEPPAREELDIIAARPLFSPSRRPVAAQAAEPKAPAPLPPLELIGVLLTDIQQAALIRPRDGGAAAWVRENEAVAGWRIEKIERNRVHLRAGDRLEVVELRADTAVPADARPKRRTARDQEKRQARSDDDQVVPDSDKAGAQVETDETEADGIEEEPSD
jgi:hypothetical protein